MNNIKEIEYKDCCGCGACFNKCPVGAISMKENNEGFLVPIVDEDKCTNCGLCLKTCPSINIKYKNDKKPECYAAMADDEIRKKSSSGGMFTLLANYILEKGGYVCGAAYKEDWNVHHIIVDNKDDLDKLRGSKYIQSDTEKCYTEIKTLLDNDKYVLFSGCPCQVAGLYTYLGKEYNKLITVELLCHGAPNYKILKKYLDEIHYDKKIQKIEFRNKILNWRSDNITIYHDNGIEICNVKNDPYEKGFHRGLFNRKSCAPCKYSKLPRIADFTIADFWGIEKIDKTLFDPKGVSLLVLNNSKTKNILKEIKFKKLVNIPLEKVKTTCNVTLYRPLEELKQREKFFNNFNKLSFKKNVEMCIDNQYDICLISMFFGLNYGTIFVSYAVHKLLENLGHSILTLQKPNNIWKGHAIYNTISHNFAQKHYNLSRIYDNNEDLINLNDHCNTFIVGSDQVFNPGLKFSIAFLEFVNNTKNKIAFGSSFGIDDFIEPENIKIKKQYCLNRFNHIALREKSNKLCNELYKIDAVEIIDPTLILPLEEYRELCKDIKLNINKPYLLTYILDINEDKAKAIKYIAQNLGLEIINIQNVNYTQRIQTSLEYFKDYTPEEFLYLYNNASFVLTDSYHGSCFAIKFNKPFISIINNRRGALRYKMFDKLHMKHRFVDSVNQIYENKDLLNYVDFTYSNEFIKKESKIAINWLKSALENNNSSEKFTALDNYFDLIIKDLVSTKKDKSQEDLKKELFLCLNKNKIFNQYYCYKILSKILFGKKREHYKHKARILHEKVRNIRKILREV